MADPSQLYTQGSLPPSYPLQTNPNEANPSQPSLQPSYLSTYTPQGPAGTSLQSAVSLPSIETDAPSQLVGESAPSLMSSNTSGHPGNEAQLEQSVEDVRMISTTVTSPADAGVVNGDRQNGEAQSSTVDPTATNSSASTSASITADPPAPLPHPLASQSSSSAFAAAQILASSVDDPVPYATIPEYHEPIPSSNAAQATGIAKLTMPIKYLTETELQKMKPEDLKEMKKNSTQLVSESFLKQMTAVELRRLGLGRIPTGYCYSSRMTLHQELPSTAKSDSPHPEQPARIIRLFQKLEASGLTSRMERIAVREAVRDEVQLVHSPGHWERVRGIGFQTIEYLEQCSDFFDRLSLYVNQETAICARLSCGGVIEMCRAVAEGQIRNGFAIVRPPGHHAEPEDAMGFCFFNNVAVAAKWLKTIYDGETPTVGNGGAASSSEEPIKIAKILILDWDVHHGNGTQKAFFDDPDILYISLHRHDGKFYPGGEYGSAAVVGVDAGKGFSVNIPFPETGMGDTDYIYAFQQVVMPIAYEFKPDMVIVSAGYDAADGDELGLMKVTPAGFAHMTHMLSVLANGKLVLALEGGYNVTSVVASAHACVEVLLGDEPRILQLGAASPSAVNTIQEVIRVQSKYWKCMGPEIESEDELKAAGQTIPVSEMLKAHRTYDLYHEYNLYNISFADATLQERYADQLLFSPNVYQAETLLFFMHDLGSIKAMFTASSLDINVEKTLLLDTSRAVLNWAMRENAFGVVDVNFLAHLRTSKGQIVDSSSNKALDKQLALYIWDNVVSIAAARNVILFGMGIGASAMMNIMQNRPAVRHKVKACVSVLGLESPPELDAASGVRTWYKENSMVLLPSTHPLHEDARKAGKHQKKYGNVYRATMEDEGRPAHLLNACLPKIKEFVHLKLPSLPAVMATQTPLRKNNVHIADVEMHYRGT